MKNLHEYIRFEFTSNNNTYKASEFITGTMTIQALKDFSFDLFNVKLNKRVKGQLSTPKAESFNLTNIASYSNWKAGQVYEYHIEFQIPENAFSYIGENVEIIWAIEFELDPDDETSSTLRKDFLKNVEFHSLFKSFRNFKHEYYINIIPKETNYEIVHEKKTLDNDKRIYILLGLALLIIAWYVFKFAEQGFFISLILTGIGVYVLYKNIHHSISIGKLGKLVYITNKYDEEYFSLKLRISKKQRSIKSLNYYCSITEQVTDDRGTSSTTRTETIYKSPYSLYKQAIKRDNEFIVPFPINKTLPHEINIPKVEIIWNVSLKIEFNNGTSYTQDLPINISKI